MDIKKRKIRFTTAFVGLALFLTACISTSLTRNVHAETEPDLPPTDLNRVVSGVAAPDFTLESAESEPVTLSSYRDEKNVVLVFYRGYW